MSGEWDGFGRAADDRCPSCGRYLTDTPALGESACESISSHECGYPVAGGQCRRYWGHSAYDGIGHNADRNATRKRGPR